MDHTSSTSILIRDYIEDDLPFIYSTWLKALRGGNDWFKLIPSKIYFSNYHRIIENMINSPAVEIKVACLADSPDVILGYSVYNNETLHWVFTKKVWRSIGIARRLVPASINTTSHLTLAGAAILAKQQNVVFNPFAI